MKRHFDMELKELSTDLLRMAEWTEKAIYRAVEALKKGDISIAESVISDDAKIDEIELKIEEYAINLLVLRQPMAGDLRFITTGMKINAELERIADLAVNICQRVIDLGDQPLVKPLIDISKLTDMARKMVKDSIDSFVSRDEKLAQQVIFNDPEADKLRNAIHNELIDEYIAKDTKTANRAVLLILVARHLERICDHATYIAQDVIYMINAKVIKHHLERLKNDKNSKI